MACTVSYFVVDHCTVSYFVVAYCTVSYFIVAYCTISRFIAHDILHSELIKVFSTGFCTVDYSIANVAIPCSCILLYIRLSPALFVNHLNLKH